MRLTIAAIISALALAGPARAVLPSEQLADPTLEARARTIGAELRCVVCQNQSIDDSDAALASDLRVILRQRLLAGDSDRQARDYIVKRYGDYVLLDPPFKPDTLLLWLGPALVVVGGGIWVALLARGRMPGPNSTPPLTPEEHEHLLRRLEAESAK
jgi:cytochrome c-type biogenesis protein CcmH